MRRAPLRVAVLGAGTVGREVVRGLLAGGDRLCALDGAPLVLAGVACRDLDRARRAGIPGELLTDAPAHLVADPDTDVVVELLGGDEPARTLIAAALGAGKPVVTANKHVGPTSPSGSRRPSRAGSRSWGPWLPTWRPTRCAVCAASSTARPTTS